MSGERSDREAIERTLAVAAARPLDNFYKQADDEDERHHPTLARVIKAIVGEARWRARPNQSLLDVVWDAILALPEHLEVREGRKEQPPVPSRGKPERDIAALLYGYEPDSPTVQRHDGPVNDQTYDQDYRPAALRLGGIEYAADKTKRRMLEVIREDLANVLLTLERQAKHTRPTLALTSSSAQRPDVIPAISEIAEDEPPFIPRPDLTERLENAWHAGPPRSRWRTSNLICVIGDAGTGKSRLVRECTAADHPVWIEAEADEAMLRGMVPVLEHYGVEIARFDTARVKHAFGQLLARVDGPEVVVFDGIGDPASLGRFIPRATRSHVIVTSRQLPPTGWAPVVDVPDMSLDEGAALAAALLPGFSEPDYASLAAIFGCRPLLIKHGCQYVKQSETSDISAFCKLVSKNLETVTSVTDDRNDRTLTVIYQEYVRRLESEAPGSLDLLELFSFGQLAYVPPELAMSYLLGVPYITPELLPEAQLRYDAALRPLLKYSLVSSMPGYGTAMQPLTQSVLRQIFDTRLPYVLYRAMHLGLWKVNSFKLFDAGWHIFTVAGRMTFENVISTYAADRFPDLMPHHAQRFEGVVGGTTWTLLVNELYARVVKAAVANWALLLIRERGTRDDTGSLTSLVETMEEVQARFEHPDRPLLQRTEAKAASKSLDGLLKQATAEGARVEWFSDGMGSITVSLHDLMNSLVKRHEDSPLGTLDLGVFFGQDWDASEHVPESVSDVQFVLTGHLKGSPAYEEFAALTPDEQQQWIQNQKDRWARQHPLPPTDQENKNDAP